MDSTSRHPVDNFASHHVSNNNLCNVGNTSAVYSTDASLLLDSPSLPSYCFSNSEGNKRKWSQNDGSGNQQDSSSLVLSLGRPSSSCTIISLGLEDEIEAQSSIDSGLNINLDVRNEATAKQKNGACGSSKGLIVENPNLQLSLSSRPADSDITTVTQGFPPFPNIVESPVVIGADEGSTSSRWKLRPPLHRFQSTESSTPFDHPYGHVDLTPITPNPSSASSITLNGSVTFNSGATYKQQKHGTRVKACRINGCTRGARGASGICIAHGGEGRCRRAGCLKGAEGKTAFCKAHGGGRRCQHLGCVRSAEVRTDRCISHGGGRRCSHESCIHAARAKYGVCIRHGGGKRCKMENCTKSAERKTALCISHGGGRHCQYRACTSGAQGRTKFCKRHGGGKRCTAPGCKNGAEGSTTFCKGHGGGKRCSFEGGCTTSAHGGTLFCVKHGGGKRCVTPECTTGARGSTNFCARHGGGERCKIEVCEGGAQGSFDFCKAHGGRKRCSWGHLGSEFGGQAGVPFDKFSRGKSALCAAHIAQQDMQIHGRSLLVHPLHDAHASIFGQIKENNRADGMTTASSNSASMNFMGNARAVQVPLRGSSPAVSSCVVHFSLPEGRVHRGNLMAMLRGSTSFGGKQYSSRSW